jgi:hypothetical protein
VAVTIPLVLVGQADGLPLISVRQCISLRHGSAHGLFFLRGANTSQETPPAVAILFEVGGSK